jgi:hypothetical protein
MHWRAYVRRVLLVLLLSAIAVAASRAYHVAKERRAFGRACKSGSEESYRRFLADYPASAHRGTASERMVAAAWAIAKRQGTVAACRAFLARYPKHRLAREAEDHLRSLNDAAFARLRSTVLRTARSLTGAQKGPALPPAPEWTQVWFAPGVPDYTEGNIVDACQPELGRGFRLWPEAASIEHLDLTTRWRMYGKYTCDAPGVIFLIPRVRSRELEARDYASSPAVITESLERTTISATLYVIDSRQPTRVCARKQVTVTGEPLPSHVVVEVRLGGPPNPQNQLMVDRDRFDPELRLAKQIAQCISAAVRTGK